MLVMTIAEYLSKLNLTISTLPNFHHRLIPDWRDFPNDQSFLGLCYKFYIKQQYLTYLLFRSIFNKIIIAVNFSAHLLFKTRKKKKTFKRPRT